MQEKQTIIVTDSTADLTPEEIKEYGIHVVPMNIHFGPETFKDDSPFSRQRFFSKLSQSPIRPTTSSPTILEIREAYERVSRKADTIISIHISRKLSDTFRKAQLAAKRMLGRCHTHVIDSEVTSVGLGILVKHAAKMAQREEEPEEIIRTLRGMIDHIYVVFFVESLDYLEQGGRIGKAQALLGTMLNIKPMLILEEGEIEPLEKVRTRVRAIDKLAEFVAEFGHIESLTIMHNQSPEEELKHLMDRLEAVRRGKIKVSIARYGPILAAHIGPDAVGIVVYEGLRDNPWDW